MAALAFAVAFAVAFENFPLCVNAVLLDTGGRASLPVKALRASITKMLIGKFKHPVSIKDNVMRNTKTFVNEIFTNI